jgi:site-specific recombinase XerD
VDFLVAIMLFKDAINEFSNWRQIKVSSHTVVRYDKVLKIFCLYLRNPHIESITLNDVMNYLNMMKDLGWKRNGIIIVTLALKKFFEFYNLQKFNVINESLIPTPRKEYNIPRIATEQGYRKLINSIPKDNKPHHIRNRALMALLWDTGARNGEILSLNVSDLNLSKRTALIRTEKSRGRRPIREIFWTPSTNALLKRWVKKRRHLFSLFTFEDLDALFISISKCGQNAVRGRRMSVVGVAEMLRTNSNRAGIPTLNAHSMRHFMGRDIVNKGGSNSDVSNILGHSSLESSMIYTMMTGPDLQRRYDAFRNVPRNQRMRKYKMPRTKALHY